MVEKIINYSKDKILRILDIGTGSGCIIISLLKELKNLKVSAWILILELYQ